MTSFRSIYIDQAEYAIVTPKGGDPPKVAGKIQVSEIPSPEKLGRVSLPLKIAGNPKRKFIQPNHQFAADANC